MERGERFDALVDRAYERLVDEIVAAVISLPNDHRQSGDDSPLTNVWLEYAAQVQGEESVLFDAYEQTITQLCEGRLQGLTDVELQLLWLDSEAYWQSPDETPPARGQLIVDVSEEVAKRVGSRAADVDLST